MSTFTEQIITILYERFRFYRRWHHLGTGYDKRKRIFSNREYDKAGWVLHMLRHVVGDSAFFRSLRAYYWVPRFAYGTALTVDFQGICDSVSGMDLNWFFQE